MSIWRHILAAGVISLATIGSAVGQDLSQGYVEGEFVWIGLPAGGVLAEINVQRGAAVSAGDVLFQLENGREMAARDAAIAARDAARARLEDLSKGSRASEVEAVRAELAEARAEAELARLTLDRQQQLRQTSAASEEAFDRAEAGYQRALARVARVEARLVTVGLAAREDRLVAAAAELEGAEAWLREQEWALSQRRAIAPADAYVQDTFYRPGEFVLAGRPVVSLLPPENVKLRFFVSETRVATLRMGDLVAFTCDGCPAGLQARVNYIAARAEFTPPVIYSEDVRDKLVFLVEAVPLNDPAAFHPGQPVDVTLP